MTSEGRQDDYSVTGAPWRADRHPLRRDRTAIINSYDEIVVTQVTDPAEAALIALTPEMAVAILSWCADESFRSDADAESEALYRVAEKLRQIGASTNV